MASKMPNRYIDREGLIEEETLEAVRSNEISTLQKENQKLKEKVSLQDEDLKELSNQFDDLGKSVGTFKGPDKPVKQSGTLMNMILNLANQQKKMSEVLEKVTGEKFDVILPLSKSV